MYDPRARMWAEACELLEQAERLQRQFFRPAQGALRPAWEPPVDVFETEEDLWISVALPGVVPEDVAIVVQDRTLVVTGERPLPAESRGGMIHRVEIPHGRFERRIVLPNGRFELRRRDLSNGCLTLTLRKLS
jgi:HSP20 family molecular chaperone IbpA